MNKPVLFIPLKREFFEAFVDGSKTEEFRPYGKLWNEEKCSIGRIVMLSLGYGNKRRAFGEIVSFRISKTESQSEAWKKCYGDKHKDAVVACVGIKLQHLRDHNSNENKLGSSRD